MASCTVQFTVDFDDETTDADSIATALDKLLENACSTAGILSAHGDFLVGTFEVVEPEPPLGRFHP